MLSAADFAASLRFYRDLLGGVEAYRFPEDEPAFVTLRFGDSELGIGATRGPRQGSGNERARGVSDGTAMTLTKSAQLIAFALVAVSSIALGAASERRG